MLADSIVRQTREAIAEGQSLRSIVRRLGVSRDLVRRVHRGQREELDQPEPVIARCPSCGRRIEMPCRACMAQHWRQRRVSPPEDSPSDEQLCIELRGSARARYEAIRRLRLAG